MKSAGMGLLIAIGALLLAAPAFAQNENEGQGHAIVTLLPKHDAGTPAAVSQKDLKLEIDGRKSTVTRWKPLQGSLEMVVLLDSSSRSSLGTQLDEIASFIKRLPPNARVAVGYMENGHAALTSPLSDDRAAVLRGLHMPGGSAGSNGSPYFCLSDLAKNWPSADQNARREVVMVTDGVDTYQPRYDPNDPYVEAAITDSARAGLVVYALYWRGRGPGDNTDQQTSGGQNSLLQVADATGGKSYWEGFGNPVTFEPYFDDLNRRLNNQYELGFTAPLNGRSQVQPMKLKFTAPGEKGDAPQQVMVYREGIASQP